MDRDLYRRLIRTALISSPIIALYGVAPFYIFNKAQSSYILFAGLAIMLNVLIFWVINVAIIRYFRASKNWKWYISSFAFVATLQVLLIFIRALFPAPSFISEGELLFRKYILIVYPSVSMLAVNAIILIICNSILATQKNKNVEIEIQELKVSNLEAQKQVLLQQLQPHFLFNTLSVLKSLIKENPDEAENYSIKLSDFLRYSVQMHKSDMVSVEQELKFTNDYIDLQKIRFESSVIFDVCIPYDVYKMQIPAYALQTLVENALKHNSFTEKRPLRIKINCIGGGAILVSNNKMLANAVETTGTGLKNLNQRYRIIANKDVEITDTKDEFTAKLHLLNGIQI
ncbi:sensor histidine kinase [Mucilaginibacter sp. OK283]|jgi:sensor histidine kinase YesM|uniref:sensor histidine kinase n=1 Tax=Mucilaginibacter sp. OK283 TaxID=1881049 RepID=UPI0008C9D8F0|nr:histidine kinase [Mucilaginibacter sp. OK283]SEP40449.1 Histidine kinase [Mucilaginibacter sp. OK283]